MKKLGKKLTLSRETLRDLSDRQVRVVAGGVTSGLVCTNTSNTGGTGASDCLHATCGAICDTLDC